MFFVMFAQAEGTRPIADYRGCRTTLDGVDTARPEASHD